jgi:hypothetical protein
VTSFVEGRPLLLGDGFMIKDAFRGTHPSTVSL